MNIVDYDKSLDECGFIHCEVIEKQWQAVCTRHKAADALLQELGYRRIERFKLNEWYAVVIRDARADAEIDLYRDQCDYDRAADADFESASLIIGANLHGCEIAAIALALDGNADVWMDDLRLASTYSESMLEDASQLPSAIASYVYQWLWFGDVPQYNPYWSYPLTQAVDPHYSKWVSAFD